MTHPQLLNDTSNIIDQPMYSTVTFEKGMTERIFFQEPIGNSVSKIETNMYYIGQIPKENVFSCEEIIIRWPIAIEWNAVKYFMENAWIDVRIGDRTCLECPLRLMDFARHDMCVARQLQIPVAISDAYRFGVWMYLKQPYTYVKKVDVTIELRGKLQRPM